MMTQVTMPHSFKDLGQMVTGPREPEHKGGKYLAAVGASAIQGGDAQSEPPTSKRRRWKALAGQNFRHLRVDARQRLVAARREDGGEELGDQVCIVYSSNLHSPRSPERKV